MLVQVERRYVMKKIKVLLSSRPKLLSDVMRNMIERQPDMEMAGEVIDPIELLRDPRATMVDAVIVTPLESSGKPKICHHLLVAYPKLKVVTLSEKGETAYLYQSGASKQRINEPSEQSILDAIREALFPMAS
jgi:DNA-binding NarL/FixJ family response regulator